MRPTSLAVGACAAALIGAVTGATLRTEPLKRGVDAWDHIPRQDLDAEARALSDEPEELPDHYPLVTPQGRFEVAELRERGLYRNRRFAIDSYWIDDPEPAYEVAAADYRYLPLEQDEPEPAARTSPERSLAAKEPQPVVLAAAEEEPIAAPPLANPPSLAGAPRVIDVSAELAERR